MYAQLSAKYRMIGRSLYHKEGTAFIHCAIVPFNIKSLTRAVAWFESAEREFY